MNNLPWCDWKILNKSNRIFLIIIFINFHPNLWKVNIWQVNSSFSWKQFPTLELHLALLELRHLLLEVDVFILKLGVVHEIPVLSDLVLANLVLDLPPLFLQAVIVLLTLEQCRVQALVFRWEALECLLAGLEFCLVLDEGGLVTFFPRGSFL